MATKTVATIMFPLYLKWYNAHERELLTNQLHRIADEINDFGKHLDIHNIEIKIEVLEEQQGMLKLG